MRSDAKLRGPPLVLCGDEVFLPLMVLAAPPLILHAEGQLLHPPVGIPQDFLCIDHTELWDYHVPNVLPCSSFGDDCVNPQHVARQDYVRYGILIARMARDGHSHASAEEGYSDPWAFSPPSVPGVAVNHGVSFPKRPPCEFRLWSLSSKILNSKPGRRWLGTAEKTLVEPWWGVQVYQRRFGVQREPPQMLEPDVSFCSACELSSDGLVQQDGRGLAL